MKPVRVLLADDHTLVRAGISALLGGLSQVRVVAEAGDGREALNLIGSRRPDVILMDIAMPGLNGLEALAQVVDQFPYVRVILLSMHANEEYVLRALRLGAAGYLLKDSGISELELALEAAMRGDTYLCPRVANQVADYVRRLGNSTGSSLESLTPRQREVLQLIAEGHTTQGIAQILQIKAKTVETHRAQLMDRLAIHDIAGLVRYAIREGVVAPEV